MTNSGKHSRIAAAVAALVAAIALLGGCGTAISSSSDSGSSASSSQSESSKTGSHDSGSSQSDSNSADSSAKSHSSDSSDSSASSKSSDLTEAQALSGTELATTVLNALSVKGRAPKTGYSRAQFGKAWADVDHNGCDTRNDILNRDMTSTTHRANTHDCVVTTGVLKDPYTGKTIHFKRGERTSTAVQIDHVVALSNAWQTGAQKLSAAQREQLANDPYNLLAVDGPANQQKSDSDAASWLPPNKSFRCEYVARQIGVKFKYHLWVTPAEKAAMERVLSGCPTQKVPADK